LAEAHQADVGQAEAHAGQREAADAVGAKAGLLDEARAERVVRGGYQQRLLFVEEPADRGLHLPVSWRAWIHGRRSRSRRSKAAISSANTRVVSMKSRPSRSARR